MTIKNPVKWEWSQLWNAFAAIFLAWLTIAWAIFNLTLGPDTPTSLSAFANDVAFTSDDHTMMIVGVGFLFALLAMSVSVISFPLLLDRDVGLDTAFKTSVRAVWMNPGPMALWGFIVAATLAIGSIPMAHRSGRCHTHARPRHMALYRRMIGR